MFVQDKNPASPARVGWRNLLSFCLLISVVLTSIASYAYQADPTDPGDPEDSFQDKFKDSRDPFKTDSNGVGLQFSAPYLSYNEFSGKVSVELTQIGMGSMALPLAYNAPNRREMGDTGYHDDQDFVHQYWRSPMGIGWHMGFGYIVAKQTIHALADRSQFEQVGYVDGQGNWNSFAPDFLFVDDITKHETEPTPGHGTPHWVDASLRRITRVQEDDVHYGGNHPFYLLMPDGTRIRFDATKADPRSPGDTHADRDQTWFYYYPTEVKQPNGRLTTITYLGGLWRDNGGAGHNQRPLVRNITDSWGRRLVYEYAKPSGSTASYISGVRLQEKQANGSFSEVRRLADFTYAMLPTTGGTLKAHLTGVTLPEGTSLKIGYQSGAELEPYQEFPLVDQLTLPTGGQIHIDYKTVHVPQYKNLLEFGCATSWFCKPPLGSPNTFELVSEGWLRVEAISWDGNTWHFEYEQTHEDVNGTIQSRYLVKTQMDNGVESFAQLSKYHSFPQNHLDYTTQTLERTGMHIGKPLRRQVWHNVSVDLNNPPAPSAFDSRHYTEETWEYSSGLYAQGNVGHFAYGQRKDMGTIYDVLILKHSQYVDGQWVDTEFEYDSFDPGQPRPVNTGASFNKPYRVTQRVRGSSDVGVREMTYKSYIPSFLNNQSFPKNYDPDMIDVDMPYAAAWLKSQDSFFNGTQIQDLNITFHQFPFNLRLTVQVTNLRNSEFVIATFIHLTIQQLWAMRKKSSLTCSVKPKNRPPSSLLPLRIKPIPLCR